MAKFKLTRLLVIYKVVVGATDANVSPLSPLIEGFGDLLGLVGSRFAPLKPTNKDARTKVPVVTAGLPSNRPGIQEVFFFFSWTNILQL